LKSMKNAMRVLRWIRGKFLTKTFLKFAIVGGSGVIVNMLVFLILTNYTSIHHLIASAIATETAILNNFTWNHLWTFRRRGKMNILVRIAAFHASRILGLIVTVAGLYVLSDLLGLPMNPSYVVAIGLGVIANFLTSDLFVWPGS